MTEAAGVFEFVAVALAAYLLGSIPTGALVARRYRNIDLTQVGSQRTGATNVSRTLGVGAGVVVLLGDLGKGALAVWLAQQALGSPTAMGLAWLLVVFGHTRSVFLRWRGGRGVGSGLGGLAVLSPPLFSVAAVTGCVIAALSRYISLGSVLGACVALVGGLAAVVWGLLPRELLPFLVLTPLLVLWAHQDNIERLRAGRERRIGERV